MFHPRRRAFARHPALSRVQSVAIGVAVAVLTLLAETGRLATHQFVTTFEVIALGLFVSAGALRTARWRVHRDRAGAVVGSALVVLGVGLLSQLQPGPARAELTGAAPEEIRTALLTAAVVALLAHALLLSSRARPRPVVTIVAATSLVTLGSSALVAMSGLLPDALRYGGSGAACVRAGTAVAWALLALLAVRRRGACAWAGRTILPLAGMSAAAALYAVALLPSSAGDGLAVAAALVTAAVACTAMHHALADVEVAAGADQAVLERELLAATAAVAKRDAWREDLGHDATNALAGLRSALGTLERYAAHLDAATISTLQQAALAEVNHVERLLERREADPRVELDVAAAVRDVVATRRATGSRVRFARLDGTALGRPGDLATVLHNLLINAARHGPGARTVVDVERLPGLVEIHVVDDGPGMPDGLAARVFERGVHGGHRLSTGLGLFIARQLMREQGGDLELRGHAAGCHFVLTLPSAEAVRELQPADPVVGAHGLLGTAR
ncbi:sensor histidine kinase [Nocardioides dongkuii]|uniref:sensor histidine kinase n=1 Tax=Nocardioides dongkuii TaxID=2760089 RepID=UPI0015FB7019|nr:sensor histidine kinase [Nocardioides dongkuii]